MEERGVEQRRPPKLCASRHHVQPPYVPRVVQLEHGGPDDRDARRGADPCELQLQPPRHRDVVRVEPRDVGPARLVQPSVQRDGEAALLVVAKHTETRVVELVEDITRSVRGRIVHHEELEVRHGLTENALDRGPDERFSVVDCDEHGDERGVRHGCPVAYGACRSRFRRSTSSSRRRIARRSSPASWTRLRLRTSSTCASSWWSRTTTNVWTPCSPGGRCESSGPPRRVAFRAHETRDSSSSKPRSSHSRTTTASIRQGCSHTWRKGSAPIRRWPA